MRRTFDLEPQVELARKSLRGDVSRDERRLEPRRGGVLPARRVVFPTVRPEVSRW